MAHLTWSKTVNTSQSEEHKSHKANYADLISRILESIPASTALRALVPDQEPEQSTVASFLWEIIKEKWPERSLYRAWEGQGNSWNARLWKHNLAKLWIPHWKRLRS